ncbi:hypothetical protein BDV33DRAFT_210926 [Aspergillus novoparasiticus]|uniref:Uncharacterized protein n=1 Tax=Aspergillus novoparasiticus TaxID=986946 RepID=A0A5N6E5A4_9EURO|nr:hypothetical protein BDV33DRAFT_210926 [Aspergillus novoparasiticus]
MNSVCQNEKPEHRQSSTDLKQGAQYILLDSTGGNIEILRECSDAGNPSQRTPIETRGQIHPAPNLTPKALICPFWPRPKVWVTMVQDTPMFVLSGMCNATVPAYSVLSNTSC